MKNLKYITIAIYVLCLCACPSPAVVVLLNNTKGIIHLRTNGGKVIEVSSGSEVAVQISNVPDATVYSDTFRYHFSSRDMAGFESKEFDSFNSEKSGISTGVFMIDSSGFLFLARKMQNTGAVVLPKKQPKNFPVKLTNDFREIKS